MLRTLLLFGLSLPLLAGARVRMDEYALVLQDPPVAATVASRTMLRSAAALSQAARLRAAQATLTRELARRHVPVTGTAQVLLNAVFVMAPRERLAELRALPGVARVAYVPPVHMNLTTAIDLVNAPAAWNAVGGSANAGAGVKIGIIDTGIDQTHPGFQDAALQPPAGFPKGDTGYTTGKVIVARSYVAQLAGTDPATSSPDDTTPRDRTGHGTAIAMIAAGVRNTGPLGTITGVAPKAWLGNYKIFGSPGVNDTTRGSIVIQALQDALADGMDIVTLSIGDPATYGALDKDPSCGSDQVCDVRAQAVENAVGKGLTVVVPAGNDGTSGTQVPTLATINTPGTAPSAITVGASTNQHQFFSLVSAAGQSFDALFGDGPRPAGPVKAPLYNVNGQACGALSSGPIGGSFALIQRGGCTFIQKVLNAQAAGAAGVILANVGSDTPIGPLGLAGASIPTVMVGAAAGGALSGLASGSPQTTIDPALHAVPDTPDVVATFSSRGPNIGDAGIKPELVAPGSGIYTATQNLDPNSELWDPSRYTSVGSASFAVPFAAGAAALVKQRNSGFGPGQIKSAVVNTANPAVQGAAGTARVVEAGAGRLDAAAAVSAGATAEPATLGFGVINTGSLPISRSLKVTNTGGAAATFAVTVTAADQSNARVTVSPASLQLNPGQSGTVSVQLQGTAPGAGSYQGAVAIAGGSTNLRVPYLYLVGDAVAANIFPIINGSFTGVVNDRDWLIGFKLVDRYGVPVTNAPVQFQAAAGGGTISQGDATTDKLGIAAALVNLGATLGDQIFTATAGGLTVEFDGFARLLPTISTGGVVNAASGIVGQGLAPGSYISIFGSGLSDSAKSLSTTSLPLSMAGVSVSFDADGVSVPGRLSYVSDRQVNVQIPWELQGRTTAQMKVTADYIPSALYTVPLADASPAPFEYTDPGTGQRLTAALDINFGLITPSNPARKGQVIQIYANGLGPVDPQPASGEPSPGAEPLARTRTVPVVTIGGRPAPVSYSGMAPLFVGLYQVNVTVPADAPTGIQPVVIAVGGVESRPANLPVQ